jgi:hypothetical protein
MRAKHVALHVPDLQRGAEFYRRVRPRRRESRGPDQPQPRRRRATSPCAEHRPREDVRLAGIEVQMWGCAAVTCFWHCPGDPRPGILARVPVGDDAGCRRLGANYGRFGAPRRLRGALTAGTSERSISVARYFPACGPWPAGPHSAAAWPFAARTATELGRCPSPELADAAAVVITFENGSRLRGVARPVPSSSVGDSRGLTAPAIGC